jgi:hypothetical protein
VTDEYDLVMPAREEVLPQQTAGHLGPVGVAGIEHAAEAARRPGIAGPQEQAGLDAVLLAVYRQQRPQHLPLLTRAALVDIVTVDVDDPDVPRKAGRIG